jgi:predicted RNA binding protein YcfA (HicA-like mRNA interferase family)
MANYVTVPLESDEDLSSRGPAESLGSAPWPRGDTTKLVESDGWKLVRTRGSHRHYHRQSKPGIVTIAGRAPEELDPKTQASTLKQAGLPK